MRVRLSFLVPGVQYQSIELDATTTLSHSGDVEITEHPLEDGANIADGARAKQPVLSLEGMLTDFSLAPDAKDTGSGTARSKYLALRAVKDAGGVVFFESPLDSYENMLIKSLSAPEGAQMGRAVKFSMQLAQVKLVRTQTVALKKVKNPNAQPHQKGGPQQPKPTTEQLAQQGTTLYYDLGGAVTLPSLQHGG